MRGWATCFSGADLTFEVTGTLWSEGTRWLLLYKHNFIRMRGGARWRGGTRWGGGTRWRGDTLCIRMQWDVTKVSFPSEKEWFITCLLRYLVIIFIATWGWSSTHYALRATVYTTRSFLEMRMGVVYVKCRRELKWQWMVKRRREWDEDRCLNNR